MRILVGTSGFSYDAWKGSFYPADLPTKGRLRFYGERLPTVEINNTFYQMPKPENLAQWAAEVPDTFTFVLKAPQTITHRLRLKDAEQPTARLFEVASALGPKRGPFLFQLPPFQKKDLERLTGFLAHLPAGMRAAVEFRHDSWFDDSVFEALRTRGAALCTADNDDGTDPLTRTADWGYLRLRRSDYSDAEVAAWADRIRSQAWVETYVFFKHEDEGKGPKLAAQLLDRLREPQAG